MRDQDTRAATRMLELLSDVLRQVLRTDQPHEISLDDELQFLERYLAIEQVRFSDRLRATIDVEASLRDAAVPAFVLQPLVENALRHGVAKRSDAGQVAISARRAGATLVLSVCDDGAGLPTQHLTLGAGARSHEARGSDVNGRGLGLSNTRERLTTLYGERAHLELRPRSSGGTIATVTIPYRSYAASSVLGAPHSVPGTEGRVPSPDSPVPTR